MPEPSSTSADNDAKTESTSTAVPTSVGGSEKSSSIPRGVVPLFFTGAGQQVFQCVVDQDVTSESPHKLIAKDKILEDFKNRAAVSDFHPVKKKIRVNIFYIMHTIH